MALTLTLGNFKKAIFNTTLTAVASTDVYCPQIPSGTRRITFQSRTANPLYFAWTTTGAMTSNAQFMTLKTGHAYNGAEDFLDGTTALTGGRIYFRGSTAGQVVETEVWYTT